MATQAIPILALTSFITIAIGLILVLIAYQQAKSNNFKNHKFLMIAAAAINAAFLVQYVVRFMSGQETHFTGPETVRNFIYLPILVVHIVTAVITVALVIIHLRRSFIHEQQQQNGTPYFTKEYRQDHRSFGKLTFNFWTISFAGGIIIFLMLYVLF